MPASNVHGEARAGDKEGTIYKPQQRQGKNNKEQKTRIDGQHFAGTDRSTRN